MLYRAGITVVALFWVAMWALLIRSELRPQETAWRAVPVELVLKQLFQHGQSSDLSIRSGEARIGHLRLSPKADEQTGFRELEILGNVQVDAPGAAPQRAFWDGRFEMDADFRVTLARGSFTLRTPGPLTAQTVATQLELTLRPLAGRGDYRLSLPGEEPVEQDFTLDQAGVSAVLARWGIGPEWIRQLRVGGNVAPQITARQARLEVREEQLETYLVTIKNQGQTLMEMHVSQLGQVLQAKTILGWELATE